MFECFKMLRMFYGANIVFLLICVSNIPEYDGGVLLSFQAVCGVLQMDCRKKTG